MSRKLSLIIGVQALLIIALFWVLIFYGKDEYEAYQNSHEDVIATPNHISKKDGMNIVSCNSAAVILALSLFTAAKASCTTLSDTFLSSSFSVLSR